MKRKVLWSVAAVLPLLLAGAAFGLYRTANAQASDKSTQPAFDCCLDPNCPLGCSDECPPDCNDFKCVAKAKRADCCPDGDCCPDSANTKPAAKKDFCPPCPFCP